MSSRNNIPKKMPAKITVRSAWTEKWLSMKSRTTLGLASHPFTWEEAIQKFDTLVAGRIDEGLSGEIKNAVRIAWKNIQVRDLDETARFRSGWRYSKPTSSSKAAAKNCRRQITLSETTRKRWTARQEERFKWQFHIRTAFAKSLRGLKTATAPRVLRTCVRQRGLDCGRDPSARCSLPLAREPLSEGTFAKLAQVLPQGAQLHVENLIVKDDEAVVELHSLATAKNGMRFDNRYCCVV